MIKPDIITVWPREHDYPLFRAFLEKYKDYYDKVIISFTGIPSANYQGFLEQHAHIERGVFVNGDQGQGKDWRDVAVNRALEQSSNEWVLFMEPDFFIKEETFFHKLYLLADNYDALSFWEANRLHPACLLVRRSSIDRTTKDFSTDPGRQLDHYGKFSEELKNGGVRIGELEQLHLLPGRDWYHMQGVTHNFNLCRDGNLDPVFKRDEFLTYIMYSLQAKVPRSGYWEFMQLCGAKLGSFVPDETLKVFFTSLI